MATSTSMGTPTLETGARSAPVDVPARWPAGVRSELERLRLRLTARIPDGAGVLDISVPEGRTRLAELLPALGAPRPDVEPDTYDHIVSVAGLVRFPDLSAAMGACDRLLAPGGTLWLLEPTGRPGVGGVVVGTLGALHPAARGSHLQRDITATLRAAGYVTPDLERFTMPTSVWPLRPFVMVRAQRSGEAVG